MDEIRAVPVSGNSSPVVPAKRPVMPCPHVYDRDKNGEYIFKYSPGPTVLKGVTK